MFYICRSCYRGQVYCGDECRRRRRRQQRRRANRRYQQDPEIRGDHCQRQAGIPGMVPPPARDRSYFRRWFDPEEFSGGLYPVFTERPEGDIGLGPSAPGPRARTPHEILVRK